MAGQLEATKAQQSDRTCLNIRRIANKWIDCWAFCARFAWCVRLSICFCIVLIFAPLSSSRNVLCLSELHLESERHCKLSISNFCHINNNEFFALTENWLCSVRQSFFAEVPRKCNKPCTPRWCAKVDENCSSSIRKCNEIHAVLFFSLPPPFFIPLCS